MIALPRTEAEMVGMSARRRTEKYMVGSGWLRLVERLWVVGT
jgi:hypothetical protein